MKQQGGCWQVLESPARAVGTGQGGPSCRNVTVDVDLEKGRPPARGCLGKMEGKGVRRVS